MYLVYILLFSQTCFVYGQDIVKSSLTFVIDDTGSMAEEISQVIESSNSLFDAVTTSNDTQIENFILVTFKDPAVSLRIVTKKREPFKNALRSIKVFGGLGDCWEYSMTGIKLGLQLSLPQSLLYVYTDATAKDHWLYKEVESLALRKHIPVSFLLTGDCHAYAHEAVAEELYKNLAKATGGDVFNVMKEDISEINKYIVEKVKGRDNTILSKTFPPGYGHKVTYTVDNKMGDLLFILVGDKSNISFTGPNGTTPTSEVLVDKSGITITKLPKPAPGEHTAIFGSRSETGIKLIGKTTVTIEPGFSPFKPESFNDTSTMPAPDGNIFLAVKLHGEGVILETAQILDMDGNVIKNVTLKLVDEKSKFYLTEEFDPPKTKFLLSVYGYDEKDNSTIKRDASIPLARRDSKYEKSENIAPTVTIENAPEVTMDYEAPLRLKCKVHGYPQPEIVWVNKDTGETTAATVMSKDVADFIGMLDIDKVEKNCTYECAATNIVGKSIATINIKIRPYFKVVEAPKEQIYTKYSEEARIVCKVDAQPKVTITWHKDGKLLSSDDNIQLSNDMTTITIKQVNIESQGKYVCEAKNELETKEFHSNITVTGLSSPKINKSSVDIHVLEGTEGQFPCPIIDGTPPPARQWLFQRQGDAIFEKVAETGEVLYVKDASDKDVGIYKCIASNVKGSDEHAMNLILNSVPTVTIDNAPDIITDYDASLELKCNVHGYPKPDIVWQEKKTGGISAATVTIKGTSDYIGILNIDKIRQDATYECIATNSFGKDNTRVAIHVTTYFNVEEASKGTFYAEYDMETRLVCKIDALPKATITWHKDGKLLSDETNIQISSDMTTVTIKQVNIESQGRYVCKAKNDLEEKLFHSDVIVTGLMEPVINKTSTEIHVLEGNEAQFTCQIVDGVPPPSRQWFFQKQGDTTPEKIDEVSEFLLVKNATDINVGTYTCEASNLMGSEYYAVELILNYAPTITKDSITFIPIKNGEMLTLFCDVDGIPKPTVTWSRNGAELEYTKDIYVTANNTLKIRNISIMDTGTYTCEAENTYGFDKKTVDIEVFVPVNINIPDVTSFETLVDRDLLLFCDVGGYPTPETKWTYQDFKGKLVPNEVSSDVKTNSLSLRRLQLEDEGYYTCIASNAYSSSNITFKVEVNAPPVIENDKTTDAFTAVKGDSVLRIPCKASGKPKPTFVWKQNNLNIAIGSDWYDIDNGTLIIKNIDEKSQGQYLCLAENKVGNDSMVFNVIVDDYPDPGTSTLHKKLIEGGKTENIICDIPHNLVDLLRWYKNGKLIWTGELVLDPVKPTDEGIYSCRVSNMTESVSKHYKISVGYKPRFVSEVDTVLYFVRKDSTLLDCEAIAEPAAKVTWKLDNKTLDGDDELYELEMNFDNIGDYTCEVENGLGSISRTFTMIVKGCILDIRKDFPSTNRPLMLTPSATWPSLVTYDQYVVLNKSELFYLHCPKSFTLFHAEYVMAFCEHKSKIKIGGYIYEYAEIKCKEETFLTINKTDSKCLPSPVDTEMLQIGYTVLDIFVSAYEVCLDKTNNVPLYTKHELSANQFNIDNNITHWSEETLSPFDFDSMYDCFNQADSISFDLGTDFHRDGHCCFGKRQLVNPRDLHPGISTGAAYTYLNVVPHWSTCNTKNWFDLEERVRKLAISSRNKLTISTGTANTLRMGSHSSPTDIRLYDNSGRSQPVAEYLWKVIIYRQAAHIPRGLAIIQVNVPDLSKEEANSYILCKDICEEILWMRGTDWSNVANGFTFCCSVPEFQYKFHFSGQFIRSRIGILRDVFKGS